MKNFSVLGGLLAFVLLSCNPENNPLTSNNPFLVPPPVNLELNLNLPEYNALRFPNGTVILENNGIRGIVVYNVNNELYTAFDLTDPNHTPNSCSQMEIEGIIATCPCPDEANSYDIVTGQHQNQPDSYPMHMYRITRVGDVIRITN